MKKMKQFEVLVTGFRTVIVEAENADEAAEIASEECDTSGWDVDSWRTERELTTPREVESAKGSGAVLLENW